MTDDFTKLTEKNMDEYSKYLNALMDYICFLRSDRGQSREAIKKMLSETTNFALVSTFMEK